MMKRKRVSSSTSIGSAPPHPSGCGECRVREETIGLLRMQIQHLTSMNEKMQEKLLMMSGDAADRWHRLRMTEMAHLRPAPTEGIVPQEELTFEEDKAVSELFNQITGSFSNQ